MAAHNLAATTSSKFRLQSEELYLNECTQLRGSDLKQMPPSVSELSLIGCTQLRKNDLKQIPFSVRIASHLNGCTQLSGYDLKQIPLFSRGTFPQRLHAAYAVTTSSDIPLFSSNTSISIAARSLRGNDFKQIPLFSRGTPLLQGLQAVTWQRPQANSLFSLPGISTSIIACSYMASDLKKIPTSVNHLYLNGCTQLKGRRPQANSLFSSLPLPQWLHAA